MPGFRRALADCRAAVFAPIGDDGPAVVLSGRGDVDLVAAARTVFDRPKLARVQVQRRALRVAMTVGPDLGQRVLAADEGVVRRHAAVRRDTQDLAEICRKVLCLRTLRIPLTRRHEQVAVACEHEPRAKMILARDLGLLSEDDLEVREPAAVEARARDGCPIRSIRRRFCVREVDRRILPEGGIEYHVEQPTLPFGIHLGQAGDRIGQRAFARDIPEAPRPLGDENPAVRQECERPGMRESARDRRDRDLRLAARRHLRRVLAGAGGGCSQEERDQATGQHRMDPHGD
jgi:hypothetical protein